MIFHDNHGNKTLVHLLFFLKKRQILQNLTFSICYPTFELNSHFDISPVREIPGVVRLSMIHI